MRLSEWRWGAGRGTKHAVPDIRTGMGAGLILNGRLYTGTNDMAGEIGHIRLEHDGPVGYGKAGSLKAFARRRDRQTGATHAEAVLNAGGTTSFAPIKNSWLPSRPSRSAKRPRMVTTALKVFTSWEKNWGGTVRAGGYFESRDDCHRRIYGRQQNCWSLWRLKF